MRNVGGGRLPVLIGIFETLSDAADIFMYYLGFFRLLLYFSSHAQGVFYLVLTL